jgi:hypothetical protein
MFASADKNELRETTVRDLSGFFGWLVLGDLVKNFTTYALAKKKQIDIGKVFNGLDLPKEGGFWKKLAHIVSKIKPKTHAEIDALKLKDSTTKIVKGISNKATLAGWGVSAAALGIFIPWLNKVTTNMAVKEKSSDSGHATASSQKKAKNLFSQNFEKNRQIVEQTLGSLTTKTPANTNSLLFLPDQNSEEPIYNHFLNSQKKYMSSQ